LIERPLVELLSIDEDGNLRDSQGNIIEEEVDYEEEPDEEILTEEEILMENDPFLQECAKGWDHFFSSEEETPEEETPEKETPASADWLGQENFFDNPDIRAVPIPDWEEKIDRLCGEGKEAKTFLYEELREARRTAERVLVIAEFAWEDNKEEVTTQMANLIVTLHNVQRACSALDMFPSPAHAEDKKRLLDTYGLELAL